VAFHRTEIVEVFALKEQFGVVRAWHDAVNHGDADELVALSHGEIEIGGPRGSGQGSALLREWLDRAGIELEPRRRFSGLDAMVVEQIATWRPSDGGRTDPATIASSFQVEAERVRRTIRYDSLQEALAATGLTVEDEVSPDAS